jgi:hypothetical protein
MLLAAETYSLIGHDIASEATSADKYRDSDRDTTRVRSEATWRWHFVNIELPEPDLASAVSVILRSLPRSRRRKVFHEPT